MEDDLDVVDIWKSQTCSHERNLHDWLSRRPTYLCGGGIARMGREVAVGGADRSVADAAVRENWDVSEIANGRKNTRQKPTEKSSIPLDPLDLLTIAISNNKDMPAVSLSISFFSSLSLPPP